MELDKKIIDGKKPLDCFDVNIAKQYVGKECYFSDHLCTFNELLDAYSYVTADMLVSKEKYLYVGELLTIRDSGEDCYEASINGESEWFQFCLPCEWVKEPEKKYRPYTLTEFVNTYPLGDEVIIRTKDNSTNRHVLFTEYEEGKGRDDVRLGQYWYTFMILFNNYELYIDGKWQPFGVEE